MIIDGIIQYQLETTSVTGCGFFYFVDEFVIDDFGKANIEMLLVGIVETDFEKGWRYKYVN